MQITLKILLIDGKSKIVWLEVNAEVIEDLKDGRFAFCDGCDSPSSLVGLLFVKDLDGC
jgi:hypothetical protein